MTQLTPDSGIGNPSPTADVHSSLSSDTNIGQQLYRVVSELFPICRSITGDGVRKTLAILAEHVRLDIHEVPTGTAAFDWTVPKEWNIRNAFMEDENGTKIIDFNRNNLHVVGYSTPIDKWMSLQDLQPHLYSLEEQPDAIPYVTSYYQERWGFCLTHHQRMKLKDGRYHVFIDSELKPGHLTYGECIIPGESQQEIFLSSYVCHPSMANNELSGPVILAFIAKWIASQPRRYTYRIIFMPETIGAIVYLSRHLDHLKKNVIAGFNLSTLGDDLAYSYVASRYENSMADKVANNILSFKHPGFKKYSFLERGSDERQYCSPGVDLPLVTLSRSKYGTYPQYHTSLDNLEFITPSGLTGGYELIKDCLQGIEMNKTYVTTVLGEPQLGKRGLYPTLDAKTSGVNVRTLMDFIAYADGKNDLFDISKIIKKPVWELWPIAETLLKNGLLKQQAFADRLA